MRIKIARVCALAACLFISGCVALGGIDRETGIIDQSVGKARNTSILLNIVRASQGEPLYFYSINQVGGSGLEDFKLSLPPITVGPHQTLAQKNYTFGTNGLNVLESQVSGNFNVAVLDSKNFYTGMLAPLDLVEVNLLLKQGFPRELVYRLVVQDVTVYWAPDPRNPKGELDRFVNDPTASNVTSAKFDAFLNEAIAHGITVEEYQVAATGEASGAHAAIEPGAAGAKPPPGPVIQGRLCSDLALLSVPLATDIPGGKPETIQDVQNDVKLTGNACGVRAVPKAADPNVGEDISDLQTTFMKCKLEADERTANEGNAVSERQKSASSGGQNRVCATLSGQVVAIQLDTRSLYGIYRYLGKMLANQHDVELNGWGAPEEPLATGSLMKIVKDQVRNCFAMVNFHGHYCIPQDGSVYNVKEEFSIINALQAFKTSAGDLPFTPTVRIEQ